MVRPATIALQNLLNSWGPDTDVKMADLYTFSLAGGETLRYSAWQQALSAPAPNTDTPQYPFVLGPPIERTKITEKIGTEVSHIDITVYAGPDDMLGLGGDLTWQAALRAGLFDGAWCRVWRAYITPPATVVGTISRFFGRVGDVEIGRTRTRITVNSLLDLLTTQMPRRLFQAACTHNFGEPGTGMCGYNRYAGQNALGEDTGIGDQTITAAAGSSQNVVYTSFVPSPTTAYDNGSIIGGTGANTGYSRTIGQVNSLQSPSVINFLKPFIFAVSPGDSFQLLPGCDHTLSTCTNTFQNQLRYGGFPDIPPPESAV
jgi:uncharacterized phage protein (TIGR02218 family)